MDKQYRVRVNDSFDFAFSIKEWEAIDVQTVSGNTCHVLKGIDSFSAKISEADFLGKKYTVEIDSTPYEVVISDELDILINKMGLSLGEGQQVNDIKAPMPGLILDVQAKEGDTVKEGDYLLVLEAMKMENALTAPRDGTVKSVAVKKGQTVEKNQLLIEME